MKDEEFEVLAVSLNDPDAPRKFAESFRKTGFAILKDHDISNDEIEGMYDTWKGFFGSDTKADYAVKPGEVHGFFGYKSENAKGNAHKDLKEFYHIYQDRPVPDSVEGTTRDFQAKMIGIGSMLLKWLEQETPDDVKAIASEPFSQMIEGSMSNLLRIIHYPPLAEGVEPGEVRAAEHGDINLITLLVAGSEPGLQAKDLKGNWHDVPCARGYITVNCGDMLEMATRGYYPSTPHRVVNPPKQENRARYSMPLFVHPRPDVRLDKMTAGEYLAERLSEIRQD